VKILLLKSTQLRAKKLRDATHKIVVAVDQASRKTRYFLRYAHRLLRGENLAISPKIMSRKIQQKDEFLVIRC
jgi:hypothetical protein